VVAAWLRNTTMTENAMTSETASDNNPLELTYTGVFVRSRDHVIIPAIVDSFADDRRDHALVQHRLGEEWVQHLVENSICGVCATGADVAEVFNVGVDGRVVVARIPGGEANEVVDSSMRGPNFSETLRCVRLIGGQVHVAGMARQCYRRNSQGSWSAIDLGTYLPRGQRTEAVGFLDLDGFELSEVYAAGYKGEIWSMDGNAWKQEASPTNVALTKVLASASQGHVFVAGLAGTLIRGRKGRWDVIAAGQVADDFWGLEEFNGKLFLATNQGLYVLNGDALAPVNLGTDEAVSTSYLHSADGILYSVGPKDVLMTENGLDWVVVPKP
jgi:hypothetical protein